MQHILLKYFNDKTNTIFCILNIHIHKKIALCFAQLCCICISIFPTHFYCCQIVQKSQQVQYSFLLQSSFLFKERLRGVFHLALNNYQSHETKIEKEFSRYIYNSWLLHTTLYILSSAPHTLNEVYPQSASSRALIVRKISLNITARQ